ncbi:MAG: septum site-determining protein MinC [Limnochordia bacterium]
MNSQLCAIKGSRDGLVVTITDAARFAEVLDALEKQLIASQSFFQGSTAKLLVKQGTLSAHQLDEMERLIARYGMNLDRQPPSWGLSPVNRETLVGEERAAVEDNTLLVKRTIRSGQRLHYDGNVVVMGDVNPGAEIVCTGDILVLGALRGVAHAGAEGKADAIVFAFRLEPTQLRIAHLISRAPDEKLPRPQGPEIARVVGDLIQLSVYNH